jgi:hypothetical protein
MDTTRTQGTLGRSHRPIRSLIWSPPSHWRSRCRWRGQRFDASRINRWATADHDSRPVSIRTDPAARIHLQIAGGSKSCHRTTGMTDTIRRYPESPLRDRGAVPQKVHRRPRKRNGRGPVALTMKSGAASVRICPVDSNTIGHRPASSSARCRSKEGRLVTRTRSVPSGAIE